jgi:ATP-dependent helicase/nuclease subunit A
MAARRPRGRGQRRRPALAALYVTSHQIEKDARGALDFADLIDKTKVLLTEKVDAAWVLYKLDGGIDHILLDEAQDTAPEQWAILRALTSDFFAGAGRGALAGPATPRSSGSPHPVRGRRREAVDLFVPGRRPPAPAGRDPELYRPDHRRRPGPRQGRAPDHVSYRSTRRGAELRRRCSRRPRPARACRPRRRGGPTTFRIDHKGCVDLWPLERELPGEEREAWDAPLDAESEHGANRRLAEKIAAEIQA